MKPTLNRANRQALLSVLLALLLFGCATPYQPEAGFKPLQMAGGYFEKRVNSYEWAIAFRGNAKLDSETSRDYCLIRASVLCLNAGFDYFEIVDEMLDFETQTVFRAGGTRVQETTEVYKMHIKARARPNPDTLHAFFLYNELSDRYEVD